MKILILEDNKFDSDLAKRHILKNIQGCKIEIAASIAEANKCINKNFDLALLDVKLPDGFGTDFLIELRKINKEIAIIMLTGSGDEEFVVTALSSGADDYIVKKEGYLLNLSEIILYNLSEKSKRNERTLENINVLYLEHHSTDIDLTIRHFKKAAPQFHFRYIHTGEEALKLLDSTVSNSHSYDILLIDYNLPGINAIEVTKIIRQNLKFNIPIVIVTGQGNEGIAIEALKLGADEYLVKRENYLNKLPYLLTSTYQKYVLENKKRELIESESNYRLLFENNPQPMWIYDIETLIFLEVNEAAIHQYGYSKEEFLSMNLKDIRPISELKNLDDDLNNTNLDFNFVGEWIHCKKNGEIIIVEITSHTIAFKGKKARHVLIKDITQRRKAEQQVQLLSASVEQSPVSIVITDFDGVIEYANPKFIEISGYNNDEVIGSNPRVIGSGLQNKEYYKDLWDTIKSGHIWQGEFANKKKNGEIYWENAVIAPIKNTDGEITHFVSVKEDITIRKRMIDELITAKDKAEESDRLKSAFLANMSHEIRTPMNGILGFTGLLLEPDLTSQQKETYINIVNQSGQRMLNTVNDIVEISKIEAGIVTLNLKEVNVQERLDELILFFTPEAMKKGLKLSLEKEAPKTAQVISTDQHKLDSIFTNLIKNAIKYTDKGSIEIGYDVTTLEQTPSLQFYVKDSGIGIPEERQKAIFERFIQADIVDKDARQGSGLGLSISKAYVEMLGGKIWGISEKDKGSTFFFTLPLNMDSKRKVRISLAGLSENEGNSIIPEISDLKVLIVEDDETSEMLISIALEKYSKEILKVTSGLDALEVCRKHPDIDLVLMDIQMPGMNGYETTRKIRDFNKEVIIIAQTAYALAGDREKAIEAGCNDYINKPIVIHELLSLIQQYFIQ